MKHPQHIRFLLLLGLAALAMLISALLFRLGEREVDVSERAQYAAAAFEALDRRAAESLEDLARLWQEQGLQGLEGLDERRRMQKAYEELGMVYVIMEGEQPIYWSHNVIPLNGEQIPGDTQGVLHLRNGWASFRQQQEEDVRLLVFTMIRQQYRYQNRYLQSGFHPETGLDEAFFTLSDQEDVGLPVCFPDGEFAFSIVARRESGMMERSLAWHILSVLFGLGGLLLLLGGAAWFFARLRLRHGLLWSGAGFATALLFFRAILFLWEQPLVLYGEGALFGPALYATSSLLPSLGDLMLHLLFLSVLAHFLFHHAQENTSSDQAPTNDVQEIADGVEGETRTVNMSREGGRAKATGTAWAILHAAGWYLTALFSVEALRSLLLDSHLHLDVNIVFNLDAYSLLGFLIIAWVFFCYHFLGQFFIGGMARRVGKTLVTRGVIALGLLLLGALHSLLLPNAWMAWALMGASLAVYLGGWQKAPKDRARFAPILLSLTLFAALSTAALYQFNKEKENEARKTIALQLASEQDPVAEYLFMELEETLMRDNQFKNLVVSDPYHNAAVYRYLLHHYFYDYWAKYDLQITVCRPLDPLLLQPAHIEVICGAFFDDYMDAYGRETIARHLVFLDNHSGRTSYIAQLPIFTTEDDLEPEFMVYMEFDSKFVARDMGFPELLIDDRMDINRALLNFSHATYKGGRLVNKHGPFEYAMELQVYGDFEQEFVFFDFGAYDHLAYRSDAETLILVSRPADGFLARIAPFSYLFILLFLLAGLFWLLTKQKHIREQFRMNFRSRLQLFTISMVFFSVLAIGSASAWFIYNIYENKNRDFLSERMYSILVEMEHLLADEPELGPYLEPYLSGLLLSLSNTFFTDINLYDPGGRLVASSRPKLFEEGLVGRKMDPMALGMIRSQRTNQIIHRERIGRMEYLSGYTSMQNRFQEVLGYINLPYFAKQGEMRQELSYFLAAFVNLYLLLLVGAVVAALFISGYMTKPLQLIRESLSRVQLGRANQKIQWDREDEIGSLVSEYNRMIDELAASAEMLARSERESAWREMAKQVAHEIKNPLTPMRLSVQYLEKAYRDKLPDWEERLARFTRTMTEQIDNLAVIAGAFGDFAKMPVADNNKRINLRLFIPEVLGTYKDFEKLSLNIDMPGGRDPLLVQIDRSQLLRVFNNLIKNAIQAYPKGEEARIDIRCMRQGAFYKVEVKDYGCGIPDEQKQRIYSPNFTTKTRGMGLGLSMVRSIIESAGGEVGFHSVEGQGSIFFFRLPGS